MVLFYYNYYLVIISGNYPALRWGRFPGGVSGTRVYGARYAERVQGGRAGYAAMGGGCPDLRAMYNIILRLLVYSHLNIHPHIVE